MKNISPDPRRHAMNLVLFASALVAAMPVAADVRMPRIFTDNMMVQRDLPVRVWGWADAGEAVSVTLAENPADLNSWPRLREAQTKSLSIPNSGMAVIIDTVPLDQAGDIHPRNKYDVGMRLARWALGKDYGQNQLEVSGPLFKALAVEGGKARVTFDHTGTGLMIGKKEGRTPAAENKDGKLKRFAIAGADKKWVWADAVIENNSVVVSSPEVKEPVAVRYAFTMNPDGANLYNREGLPASPFRTDAW